MADTVKPYFCGGFSACFASLCVHPIDLIKVLERTRIVQLEVEAVKATDSSVKFMESIVASPS